MQNHLSKHTTIMLLCCLAVMLALIILPRYFNFGNYGFLLILLCPLAHIVLMKSMMPGKDKNLKKETKDSCH